MALWWMAFLLFCAALTGTSSEVLEPTVGDLLTSPAQVRALSSAEAGRGHSVEIEAVVTFRTHDGNVFVHDYKDGIYVACRTLATPLAPGQLVRLRGRTAPGDYAPIIIAESAEHLGTAKLPQPRRVPFDELGAGNLDCEWVEVEGIVRSAQQIAEDRFDLEIAVQGGQLRVYLLGIAPELRGRLVDATIRLQGARGCIFNQKRQSLGPLLFVEGRNLQVLEPAPQDPFAAPTRPLGSLLQFAPGARQGHRLKVRGSVTHQIPGESVFIRDAGQGLQLKTSETELLQPGDLIEALGFETVGICAPFLENATCRKIGGQAPPTPVRISPALAMQGRFEADLVSIRGTLVDFVPGDKDLHLILENEGVVFHAELASGTRGTTELAKLVKGSQLELTGICLAQDVAEQRSIVTPDSLKILLRSPKDIAVLRAPSWWTPQRLMWPFAGVTLLFAAGMALVVRRARQKAREQERAREESERRIMAIMAERNRMAREIHDTLAQGFTAISVQLEAMKDKVAGSPQAAKHLELARSFVRSSLAEARRSIWEMRSQSLEEADLPTALGKVAQQLVSGAGIEIDLVVRGEVRRLPVPTENSLLRVGQEAVTNAIKHARPRRIVIEFRFDHSSVLMHVHDDGCGFECSRVTPGASGGFGLLGMRERIESLGGRLSIKSRPGRGTEIEVAAGAA